MHIQHPSHHCPALYTPLALPRHHLTAPAPATNSHPHTHSHYTPRNAPLSPVPQTVKTRRNRIAIRLRIPLKSPIRHQSRDISLDLRNLVSDGRLPIQPGPALAEQRDLVRGRQVVELPVWVRPRPVLAREDAVRGAWCGGAGGGVWIAWLGLGRCGRGGRVAVAGAVQLRFLALQRFDLRD